MCNFYVTDRVKFIVIHEYTIFLKYTINSRTKLIISKYTKMHTRRKLVKYTKYTIHETNKKSELYSRIVMYLWEYSRTRRINSVFICGFVRLRCGCVRLRAAACSCGCMRLRGYYEKAYVPFITVCALNTPTVLNRYRIC